MAITFLPTLVLEFAPTSAPSSTSPVWVDISGYVYRRFPVTVTRGRQSESQSFAPGRMNLALDDRTRIFDPRNSSGPYFGNLKPRKQIRLRALWGGVYYPIFQGFVTGWPHEYADGKVDAWVPLQALDALALFAETNQPDVNLIATQAAGTETLLLDQFDGTTWRSTVGAGSAAKQSTPISVTQASPIAPGLGGTGMTCAIQDSTSGVYELLIGNFPRTPSSDWSFSFWFRSSGDERAGVYLVDSATNIYVTFDVFAATAVAQPQADEYTGFTAPLGVTSGAFAQNTISSVGGANDGNPHHVVFVYPNATKLPQLYLDGVLVRTDTGAWDTFYPDTIRGACYFFGSSGSFSAQLPTFWSTALTGTQIALLYQLGSGFLEESTAARVGRLLDNISHPSALRDLTASSKGLCGDYTPFGRTTLAELQKVAATEQGRLFVSKDGKVTLHGRYYYLETTRGKTVQAIFSDDGSDIFYGAIATDFDDREIANDITVTGSRSWATNAQDATSITDYGLQSRPISTVLSTAQATADMAAGLLFHAKDAVTRTRGPIEVQGGGQTAQWPTILGLEIGDRIQHEITPLTGSQAVLKLLVEGLSWTIRPDDWKVSIDAVPVPGGTAAGSTFLVLDDTTYGVLDTGRWGF